MKKILSVILLVTFVSMMLAGTAMADDSESSCGSVFEGNWIVKNGGDIKSHLKHHIKIDQTNAGKYALKVKNEQGDIVFSSKNDFSASCSEGSNQENLSGNIKMGNCEHAMEMAYPVETDMISIKYTTVHGKGECTGHKDTLHGEDRRNHTTVAKGKRRKN
jgi:hypothetical protein